MNQTALELLFGRLHPMVLHVPIGLLIALAALESLALIRRRPIARDVVVPLVWLTAGSAILAALTGLTLAQEAATATSTLDNHKLLGIAVAVGTTLAAAATLRAAWITVYRGLLLITVGLLIPAGHLGASMTHGQDFLTEPFEISRLPAKSPGDREVSPSAAAGDPTAKSDFPGVSAVFVQRCGSCHGAERQRSQLALHTPDGIRAGGKNGPVLVAGKPEASELVRRLRLPLDDQAHMPPSTRPQPDEGEIALIERWVAAGAPMVDGPASTNGAPAETPAGADAASPPADPPADAAAIEALRNKQIHVEPLAQDSVILSIDCSPAGRELTDAELRSLLTPLRRHVARLNLSRTQAGHETIATVAEMAALTRLDLSGTAIDDADVAKLAALPALEELILTRTNLSDQAAATLQSMTGLRRLYVWKSGLTDDAIAGLRGARPDDLLVDSGDRPDAAARDAETELKFTSDAPIPGQTQAAPATSLQPVNVTCPVTGTAVDPKFVVVWKGRAIGFCCPNCPSKFWADPGAFESKLPAENPAPSP